MSEAGRSKAKRPNWVAAGFIGAFAASVFTVIYTGLNVEGSRAEFDSGFRSVTMSEGEARTIDLVFEAETEHADAVLDIALPDAVRLSDSVANAEFQPTVAIAAGRNVIRVDIEAVAPDSGYLVARLTADGEPVGIYRVFVTVEALQ